MPTATALRPVKQVFVVPCPACEGEGHIVSGTEIDRTTGALMQATIPCEACDGLGDVEEEAQPVTLDDLDQLASDENVLIPGCEPVSLIRYVGGGRLTCGQYPSAEVAMQASDETVWIKTGENSYRSQDARTLIEPVAT